MNQPNNNNRVNRNNNKNRNRRRYRGNFNKNRTPNPNSQLDRLVEKYINLLDQHLIARRKFHDLYYRADIPQLNKLERLFYQTLNDLRDFESKISAEVKPLFEKRINGLNLDTTYSQNHNISPEAAIVNLEANEIEDPHYLTSQKSKIYTNDVEESVGSMEDYLSYKGQN